MIALSIPVWIGITVWLYRRVGKRDKSEQNPNTAIVGVPIFVSLYIIIKSSEPEVGVVILSVIAASWIGLYLWSLIGKIRGASSA